MVAPADTRENEPLEPFDETFQRRLRALSLVAVRASQRGGTRGQHRSRSLGPGSEFADYRDYSAGDDYRYVDWNAYARSERLLVRQHEQETELAVYVLLDCSGSMGSGDPPKLRYALQLSAAIAYVGLLRLDLFSIVAIRDRIVASSRPARGLTRARDQLEFLRGLRAEGPTELAAACRAFCAREKRRGLVVLISDLFDPAAAPAALDVLRHARFEPRVIRILDADEPEPGEYELVDAESERSQRLTITPELLADYRAAREREAAALRRACIERHVPLHVLDSRTSPEDAVLRLLRRAGMFR
jgi:uncharacterized protein (DUF58 family)